MVVSITLNDTERELAEKYAEKHSLCLEQAFKHAFTEQIEAEYMSDVAMEAFLEFVESGEKSRPIEELWKEDNMSEQVII